MGGAVGQGQGLSAATRGKNSFRAFPEQCDQNSFSEKLHCDYRNDCTTGNNLVKKNPNKTKQRTKSGRTLKNDSIPPTNFTQTETVCSRVNRFDVLFIDLKNHITGMLHFHNSANPRSYTGTLPQPIRLKINH